MADTQSNFDAQLLITDLDTGEKISIEEYQSNTKLNSSNTCITPPTHHKSRSIGAKQLIPPHVDFSTFSHQVKDPFYKNIHIEQALQAHSGHVRCICVSPHGEFVASGGEDGVVCLFKFTSQSTLLLLKKWTKHESDITSLSFSPESFLLSASIDKCVHLWHPKQDNPLASFQHPDAVTSVAFLPTDSSIFVACTFGCVALVWSIRDNVVLKRLDFVSPPTSATFSPDGSTIALGCFNGFCFMYSLPDFRYITQFIAGPRHKKLTANKKITGIVYVGSDQFLIATNDSRVRLYAKENFSVLRKFLGHQSTEAQMNIDVTNDRQVMLSPSETQGAVFLWPLDHKPFFKGAGFSRDRSKTYLGFKLGKRALVNAAVFTKQSTANHLSCVVGDNMGYIYMVVSN